MKDKTREGIPLYDDRKNPQLITIRSREKLFGKFAYLTVTSFLIIFILVAIVYSYVENRLMFLLKLPIYIIVAIIGHNLSRNVFYLSFSKQLNHGIILYHDALLLFGQELKLNTIVSCEVLEFSGYRNKYLAIIISDGPTNKMHLLLERDTESIMNLANFIRDQLHRTKQHTIKTVSFGDWKKRNNIRYNTPTLSDVYNFFKFQY